MIHAFDDENKSKVDLLKFIYPVGSIYMNVNDVSPAELFGGSWVALEPRFLLPAGMLNGTGYAAGDMGGEAYVTLTGDSLPAHTHKLSASDMSAVVYKGNFSTRQGVVSTDTSSNYKYLRMDNGATWANASATQSTGMGNPHNNMPPYLVVYMWKRTA